MWSTLQVPCKRNQSRKWRICFFCTFTEMTSTGFLHSRPYSTLTSGERITWVPHPTHQAELGWWGDLTGFLPMSTLCVCSVTQVSSAQFVREPGSASCVTVREEPPATPSSWSAYEEPALLQRPLWPLHPPDPPGGPLFHSWSLALATRLPSPHPRNFQIKEYLIVTMWRVMPCLVRCWSVQSSLSFY